MVPIGVQEGIVAQHRRAFANRLEHERGDFKLVDAQMQDGVIEFARNLQRPERGALFGHCSGTGGSRGFRRLDRDRRDAFGAIDLDHHETIIHAVCFETALERRQRDSLAVAIPFR